MIVRHYTEIPAAGVEAGASGAAIRELITVREGAPNFAMRLFEVSPGGSTPFHAHPWEHEVFVLDGTGEISTAGGPIPVRGGDSVFIPGDEKHQFRCEGSAALRFICVIPMQNPCDV